MGETSPPSDGAGTTVSGAGRLEVGRIGRAHGLRGEKLMAQIDILGSIPALNREFVDIVPLIVSRIVDEDANWPQRVTRLSDG